MTSSWLSPNFRDTKNAPGSVAWGVIVFLFTVAGENVNWLRCGSSVLALRHSKTSCIFLLLPDHGTLA